MSQNICPPYPPLQCSMVGCRIARSPSGTLGHIDPKELDKLVGSPAEVSGRVPKRKPGQGCSNQ